MYTVTLRLPEVFAHSTHGEVLVFAQSPIAFGSVRDLYS
jgi:hypothetical protein